jgi:hypothetical protein
MPRATVFDRVWHDTGPRRFGGERWWNSTLAYSAAEAQAFDSTKAPRTLKDTQVAQAGWKGVFDRTLPKRLPPAAAPADGWYDWLSERCHLILDGRLYDGKVMHVTIKPKTAFFVLVSFRTAAAEWTHELYRVPVKGTRQRPFDNTSGAAWPGPDSLQAPGHPSSDLEALFANGSEPFVADVWSRPLDELLVAVGPSPHLYFEVKRRDGAQVWVEDDGGSILVKDAVRPKLYGGYQGDAKGRYSCIWLNKDKVKAVTKASLGWSGGDVWRRRNAAVLHAHWGSFKNVESWYKKELLFSYDFNDAEDLLKFNSFLLVAPSADEWVTAPTRADFRDRCLRADQRAYSRFDLPHLAGGVPADDAEEDEEDEDAGGEDTAETERLSLAAYPPPYVWNWSKLKGVRGKLPEPSITHDGQQVTDVFKIDYAVPSDPFHQVANSGLLNTPQLGSLYSAVGTRVHLVLGFTPLLKESGELDDGETLYVQLRHVRAGDKGSPYDVQDGRVTLKPVFREWVFEAFYAKFVHHVFEAMEGVPWLVEFPVYHPHMLVGRSGVLKCAQTFLDAIYRMPDGSLTLVDYKSLMQARPPNYRLRDLKNLRQIVTNAAYFQAMTNIRLQRASLVYITRMGTLTVLTLELEACGAVTKAALLNPLAKATHFVTYTADRLAINKQLHVQVLDDLGAASGPEAGVPIPPELKPPAEAVALAQPQQVAHPAAAEEEVPPPRQRRRSRRRSSSGSDEDVIVGALYEAGAAAAAAAVRQHDEEAPAPPAQQDTLEDRRDINQRIGDSCEAMFDTLPASSKSRLRGCAQELFAFLAASQALFPPLATADGAVAPTQPARLTPADTRPLLVQALIRTAQRALNQAVARRFLRTRGALARAEVAEGVALGEFLAEVAHHARRDLWTQEAAAWAEGHVDEVLETLQVELARFLEAS